MKSRVLLAAVLWTILLPTGCSIRRMAVNRLGDALAAQGTTFSSENDPQLVRAAAPFSLKLIESLLAENPRHYGLLTAAASGFTQFSYAFVQQDADEMEATDLEAAGAMKARARLLYLRARDYGLRGLGVKHPHFDKLVRENPKKAAQLAGVKDVPLLYWTSASWAAAISLSKDQPELVAELPIVEAMMDQALALDEGYDSGAIHSFFISYEMSRPGGVGNPTARSREHFERAMTLSQGFQAGPLVALAENVCVQNQDLKEFESLLNRALAVNVDARPEWRLANLVMQRRARWLLGRTDELFLRAGPPSPKTVP